MRRRPRKPLDELYFTWLYNQISPRGETYNNLFRILYKKEFVWIIPNDDNRLEDGRNLRDEFLDDEKFTIYGRDWRDLGCSILELLVGLSRRLNFLTDQPTTSWFWHLMRNLSLEDLCDRHDIDERLVDEALDELIWRTYGPDGFGGLFPLIDPKEDQTHVELWYQMSAYLLEKGY